MRIAIQAMGAAFWVAAICCFAADDGNNRQRHAEAQAAIVTALSVVEGHGASNQWVLVKYTPMEQRGHQVSIFTSEGKAPPQGRDADSPRRLLAVVTSTGRGQLTINYRSGPPAETGNEKACRSAVAYRTQRGWMPLEFWMYCQMREKDCSVSFRSESNERLGGDRCTVIVSKSTLRYLGSR